MEKSRIEIGKIVAGSGNLQRLIEESRGAARDSVRRTAKVSILLDDVVSWIKKKYDDAFIVNELIKIASGCPQGSLDRFVTSIDIYLRKIQKKRGDRVRKKEVNTEILRDEREKEIRKQNILQNQKKIEIEKEIAEELGNLVNFEEIKEVEQPKPKPQPQPPQQPPPQQIKAQLDMRKQFAQRLAEMSQEDEIDSEWMR
jgi:hypothetical protein